MIGIRGSAFLIVFLLGPVELAWAQGPCISRVPEQQWMLCADDDGCDREIERLACPNSLQVTQRVCGCSSWPIDCCGADVQTTYEMPCGNMCAGCPVPAEGIAAASRKLGEGSEIRGTSDDTLATFSLARTMSRFLAQASCIADDRQPPIPSSDRSVSSRSAAPGGALPAESRNAGR